MTDVLRTSPKIWSVTQAVFCYLSLYLGHSKNKHHQLPFALVLLTKCICHCSYLFAVICLGSIIYLIAFLKYCDQFFLYHSQKGSTKTFLSAVLSTVSTMRVGTSLAAVH